MKRGSFIKIRQPNTSYVRAQKQDKNKIKLESERDHKKQEKLDDEKAKINEKRLDKV